MKKLRERLFVVLRKLDKKIFLAKQHGFKEID